MFNRRSFLRYFNITWLTSLLSTLTAAVRIDKSIAKSEITRSIAFKNASAETEGFTVIGSLKELDTKGYLQTEKVAVVRNPIYPQMLVAVNPRCTHNGCTVKWADKEKKYICPCHGASFKATGTVLSGPTIQPLPDYPAKIEGDRVLVKINLESRSR